MVSGSRRNKGGLISCGAADNLVSFCRCRRQKVSLKFSMYRHVTDVAIILSDPLQLQFLRFGRAHVADERAGLGSIDGISRDNEAEHDRNLALWAGWHPFEETGKNPVHR